MAIFGKASDIVTDDIILDVSDSIGTVRNRCYLKVEGLNPCGSIKLKTARYLIDAVRCQRKAPLRKVIESSSGNLGIALASVCASEGIGFECVVDKNTLPEKIAHIRSFGAEVTVIDRPDDNGGYLASRIRYVHQRIAEEPDLVWTNQYANTANAAAHYHTTAPALLRQVEIIDYLFIGAGTTGTLLGCSKYFREHAPETRIIAVDIVGSVTFGGPAGPRHIPGMGTSRRPELLDSSFWIVPDDLVYVDERETIRQCRDFTRRSGLLIGGSTGSVLAAAERYVADKQLAGQCLAVISPDLGQAYLSTIYCDTWVNARFTGLQDPGRSLAVAEPLCAGVGHVGSSPKHPLSMLVPGIEENKATQQDFGGGD